MIHQNLTRETDWLTDRASARDEVVSKNISGSHE